jgi:HNH endonuclease
MQERTCPICGKQFTPRATNQKYCISKGPCATRASNEAYRATTEQASCAHCGRSFERIRNGGRKVYCTDDCHRQAKHERWVGQDIGKVGSACPHGTSLITTCPACTFLQRTRLRELQFKRALRADPCCVCGGESSALDHIVAKNHGGSDDWHNRAAICLQCNSLKGQLPLLHALLFIPPAREYHRLRRTLYAA